MTGQTQCLRITHKSGFALVEVLVALFVLALGVIGAAGMQLAAMQATQQANYESAALRLATEMADKLRANGQKMASDVNGNPYLPLAYHSTSEVGPQQPDKLCHIATCNPAELARYDIYEWNKRIRQSLPGGRVVICRDAKPWDAGPGALRWDCHAGYADDSPIVIKLGWHSKGIHPDGSASGGVGNAFAPAMAIAVAIPKMPSIQ